MSRIASFCTIAFLMAAAACGGSPHDRSRHATASLLRDSLGSATDPEIGYQRDSTHLRIQLATIAFPNMPDTVLTLQSKEYAKLAVRHYDKASELDSVTVVYLEKFARNSGWIRHSRTFPIENVRGVR